MGGETKEKKLSMRTECAERSRGDGQKESDVQRGGVLQK